MKQAFDYVLGKGIDVRVIIDPKAEGVVLPQYLHQHNSVILEIGLNMAIAIPDLEVTDWGVFATLSFNRSPFACRFPWSAVKCVVDQEADRAYLPLNNDRIMGVTLSDMQQNQELPKPKAAEPPKPSRGHLRVVK